MFRRFRVEGHSMEPRFRDGDFVIVHNITSPRLNDVVVIRCNGRILLKRIVDIKGKFILRGDNQHDKKVYEVARKDVLGKLLWHVKM